VRSGLSKIDSHSLDFGFHMPQDFRVWELPLLTEKVGNLLQCDVVASALLAMQQSSLTIRNFSGSLLTQLMASRSCVWLSKMQSVRFAKRHCTMNVCLRLCWQRQQRKQRGCVSDKIVAHVRHVVILQ